MPQLRHLVRLPGIRTSTTAPQEPSRRHALDARATPVCSRVRRGPPIQKVDLTRVEKKLPQFRHLVRLPDVRTRHHSIGTSGALTETRSRR